MPVRTVVAIASLSLAAASTGGCLAFYEIPIEVPLQSKIDVSAFERILVAGFLSGGSDAIDANTETARLLRSQLRNRQDLRVIDTDAIPLVEEARRRTGGETVPAADAEAPAVVTEQESAQVARAPVQADAGASALGGCIGPRDGTERCGHVACKITQTRSRMEASSLERSRLSLVWTLFDHSAFAILGLLVYVMVTRIGRHAIRLHRVRSARVWVMRPAGLWRRSH